MPTINAHFIEASRTFRSLGGTRARWGYRQAGMAGRASTGRCRFAKVRQLSTTWLTQVRLHISGDNTPPPPKKCRRNSLYSAEACGPHGRALAAPATGDLRERSGPLGFPP
jgi:hypothetical protein